MVSKKDLEEWKGDALFWRLTAYLASKGKRTPDSLVRMMWVNIARPIPEEWIEKVKKEITELEAEESAKDKVRS